MMSEVNVGMLGMGNIGSAVVKYLNTYYEPEKTGVKINLREIVVKNLSKPRTVKVDPKILSDDPRRILDNPDIDLVVELIGGLEPARSYILEAFKNGKNVVTANKHLLAKDGAEIFSTAKKYGRSIGIQASVCGEMRALDMISKIPSYREVRAIKGIFNGTSNDMLTEMAKGRPYQDALAKAQERGLAEADPTFDVDGIDASQKLALLAMFCFGVSVDYENIPREGITRITKADIKHAKEWGYVIKPLAIAKKQGGKLELSVHPALVPIKDPLASVNSENNAVSIYFKKRRAPETSIGKGAGEPTARSVTTDIAEVAKGKTSLPPIDFSSQVELVDPEEVVSPYYLRFSTIHKPGMLGKIGIILGKHDINISAVTQARRRSKRGRSIPLALLIDPTQSGNVYNALEEIKEQDVVRDCLSIRVYR